MSAPPGVDLRALAGRVDYVGSVEHKDVPGFAGLPRLRRDASCCPRALALQRDKIRDRLRSAIRRGAVGAPWERGFPRYAWYMDDGVVYEGRLVNSQTGTYKGYPLDDDEWPAGIEALYAEP